MSRISLKIPSATPGWNLDVWQYLPTLDSDGQTLGSKKTWAVVVMAHGLTATKKMSLNVYADAFWKSGYACLVFDYRRWGDSDGTPRCSLNVQEQHEDYRTVVQYARNQDIFDPERIVLWGTSYSGGHVIVLASERAVNAAAAIAQCPYTGYTTRPRLTTKLHFALAAFIDTVKQAVGMAPYYIQAATDPASSQRGVLDEPGAFFGLKALCTEPAAWLNKMTGASVLRMRGYRPVSKAAEINCPVLLIAPEADDICLFEGAALVASNASSNAELLKTEGGHWDVYPDGKVFDLAISAQLEFIGKHIPLARVE